MIFTECTNTECNEPIVLGWESGMYVGAIRHVCQKCGEISFVEGSCLGGQTLSEKEFWKKYPDAIALCNKNTI